jgi:hypothetical protein
LGREFEVFGVDGCGKKVESPIQGVIADGPDDVDESFAVRGLDELVDLSPNRAQKEENARAGEEEDEGEAGESYEGQCVRGDEGDILEEGGRGR